MCSECHAEEEASFKQVFSFLNENPQAGIDQIVEATGVKEDLLFRWAKTRRFQASHFPGIGYPCEKCSTKINQGKLCSSCIEDINRELAIFEAGRKTVSPAPERKTTYFSTRSNRKR
ncbi:hypothetical protein [Jeotgalibacillus proteolyticus]|nr:hypothetical protein [Jeotgalibacillus proteolyticus]